jgi:hypothetical protein
MAEAVAVHRYLLRKAVLRASSGVLIILLVLLALFWRHGVQGDAGVQHWLAVHTGTDYCPPLKGEALRTCKSYGYWSGFGSVIPWSMAILGTAAGFAVGWLHQVNCHTTGCWRKGRFPMADGHYKVCKRCHNRVLGRADSAVVTIEHIREAHIHRRIL